MRYIVSINQKKMKVRVTAMKSQECKENLLFLNTPIIDETQDVIGIKTYVEKLSAAIDAGAQMIAVTSPFGSGKTSIVELLEKKRRYMAKEEKIIKVSMWSQIHGDKKKASTTDLHRSFVYQLASQINHKRGTYINRRLSPNYGLIKLHANRKRYWVLFLISILLLSLGWGLHTFQEQIISILPFFKNNVDSWVTVISFTGVILGLIVITKAEIIYSAKQGVKKREIETTEIIDLYHDEILKYSKCRNGTCYIAIIEDLDRTSDANAVIEFLKELRKYYVPENISNAHITYYNKVIFIVNVKPEALLRNQVKEEGKPTNKIINNNEYMGSLYAKLFDYVLSLQTINIDNYDAILEGLLQWKKGPIISLGLATCENLSEIPGMKWIIREPLLGIREIKERLNIAFTLYESLKNKFPDSPIEFEKCAVVAYLTTAYEQDFSNTDDRAFQVLVELYIQNAITDENCSQELKGVSTEYATTVNELIAAKLIDNSYRTYFYNYPQGSYLYTSDESQIINAILYAEHVIDLEQISRRVIASNSLAPHRAFKALEQLRLNLPQTIFQSETLYIEALKQSKEKVYQYFNNLDYSSEAVAKTIAFFKLILTYDKARTVYKKESADKLCEIWEGSFSEIALLQLRLILCKEFSSEIMWYKPLFFGIHPIVKIEEIEACSLVDALSLINLDNEQFSIDLAGHIQLSFAQEANYEEDVSIKVKNFLSSSSHYFEQKSIVPLYLGFMDTVNQIIPDFEDEVYGFIENADVQEHEKGNIFTLYQNLINKTVNNLSDKTIKNISRMERYSGYNYDVAVQLEKKSYYLDYVLLLLLQNAPIPFEQKEITEAIAEEIEWLLGHEEYFLPMRNQLAKCPEEILMKYSFMFTADCPVLMDEELLSIQNNIESSEQIIMVLIPAELVTQDNYEMLSSHFSRKKQTNNLTLKILMYISTFSLETSKTCFYALDFNMVRYRYIAANKKSEVKKAFNDALKLDSPSEKILFMKTTRFLDTGWEIALLELLKNDTNLQKSYIEAVNDNEKISKNTIQTISKLGTIYSMSPLVNQRLFENKKYTEYVSSETLGKSRFDLADTEHINELWPTYIKIFSSSGYGITRKYMSKNYEFVRRIMAEKFYKGFAEENRMQLNGIYQDKDSIINVLEYGNDFALRYYTSMRGFLNEDAATEFVSIVECNSELIASDDLYNHTHGMLINGRLKARYTNLRKKHGFGN